jgi:flavin reductase (DIM6/NTAB) family NADH-FMN oxidoreductase RutF
MYFDLENLPTQEKYKFLSALVIPRPVAFVTSQNPEGLHNAAPFSFFNMFSEEPAIVILGISHRPNGKSKDTINNIRSKQQFAINMVDRSIIGAMHIASADFSSDESEIDYAGITLMPCTQIDVMRIAEAPVSFECRVFQIIDLSDRRALILGEVLGIHLADRILDPITKRVIPEEYSPIARLYGNEYAWLGKRYSKAIPSIDEIHQLGLAAGDLPKD